MNQYGIVVAEHDNPQQENNMKNCCKCKEELQEYLFNKDKNRPDGLEPLCRACKSSVRNKDKEKSTKLTKKFGISLDQYNLLLLQQNNSCGICKISILDYQLIRTNYFPVDHCHVTGKVRGLLCDACNRGIGLLKDSPEILQKAIDYLHNSK